MVAAGTAASTERLSLASTGNFSALGRSCSTNHESLAPDKLPSLKIRTRDYGVAQAPSRKAITSSLACSLFHHHGLGGGVGRGRGVGPDRGVGVGLGVAVGVALGVVVAVAVGVASLSL